VGDAWEESVFGGGVVVVWVAVTGAIGWVGELDCAEEVEGSGCGCWGRTDCWEDHGGDGGGSDAEIDTRVWGQWVNQCVVEVK
jgi:hypothetical protein